MKKSLLGLGLSILIFSSTLLAQQKVLTVDDYHRWSRIVGTELSDNGNWMAYALRPNGGDDTLFVKSLNSDKEFEIPNANGAVFSDDNNWVAYVVRPDEKSREKLSKARKPIHNTAELLNLSTGEKKSVDRMNAMAFSNGGAVWVVHRKKTDEDDSKHKGSDLLIHNLKNESTLSVGNVSEISFNKKATKLAYIVDADKMSGNGIYMYDLAANSITPVDTDSAAYEGIVWDDHQSNKEEWARKGTAFAVLKGHKNDSLYQKENELLIFENVERNPKRNAVSIDFDNMPDGMVISEMRNIEWTQNGKNVLFGIKEQEKVVEMSKDTIPNVDVWHWKDDRIQTVQMRQAARDRRFTYATVLNLENKKFTQLSDEEMRTLLTSKHDRYMVGRDEEKYRNDVNWGVSPADLYRVDITNGNKVKFAEEINRTLGYSPDGRYYLYQKVDGDMASMMLYDLQTNKTVNLSANAPINFSNEEHIYPHENPPYGVAGWTKDKKNVILNHKYDLWMISLDGSKATNITRNVGTENEIVFRYRSLTDEEYIDTSKDILLTAFGEWTKKNGFYGLKVGNNPRALIYEDASFGNPTKAENSNRVILTRQTFVDFPDYYATDTSFRNMNKVTDANPQQSEYAWGSRKLVTFENGRGQKVQGTLTLPANYVEGEKYPTVVYFYEKMSDRHHQYSMPVFDDRPHMSTYASAGYAVFMPDILFVEGRAGTSSLDGITAAVNKIVEEGFADPDRIGLQGHSWGGYQSSFILTQTNIFKTIVTGAPPTNLESFYNNIYGSTGTNHHGIMEIGQVRMGRGVTPWTHREDYQRENPMAHIPNIETPFLILHGTADGAVDWAQGLELYNAARRMGKEVIFLSYPNEGHHLGNEANQKDFLVRMQQYFDYHLKGTEPADWIVNGVPHLKKLYDRAK